MPHQLEHKPEQASAVDDAETIAIDSSARPLAKAPRFSSALRTKADSRRRSPSPYSKLPFDLDEADILTPGVQKMMLGEITRLKEENLKLQSFFELFHESDKQCAVLNERSKKENAWDVLYTVAIAIGAALLGWITNSTTTRGAIVIAICAFVLFGCAAFARWKGRS